MALFESLAAISVTLGLSIPVFIEKVMRPRYEERFEEFQKSSRENFINELNEAALKVGQIREELTPEIIETMESLTSQWGEVKTNENKLLLLLKRRKFLFVGWMFSLLLSLFSIEYSAFGITDYLTFGQVAVFYFILVFVISCWYVYGLFTLDEELNKVKKELEEKPTKATTAQRYNSMIGKYQELERRVRMKLDEFKIPYTLNGILRGVGFVFTVDFAIPAVDNLKYFIEVKTRISSSTLVERMSRLPSILKNEHEGIKGILITDFKLTPHSIRDRLKEEWDYVIGFEELDRLQRIVELD